MVVIDIIFYFDNEYEKINFLNKKIGIGNCNLLFYLFF
ncbi:conserved hypothetical protein (plasmid) [Borreliella burgdorferi WI91-23]|nr:conserved hypothetical protein [Borreliella burgdorferi WI91-23]